MSTFFEWFLFVAVIFLALRVVTIEQRLKQMTYTLKQIGQQLGVSEQAINKDILDLLDEGKDIEAVKLARETLGLSLVEGKQYVDELKAEK